MISQGRNAFPCNVMQNKLGRRKALSSQSHVQTARESHDLNMDFCGFKQLRVTNSYINHFFHFIYVWINPSMVYLIKQTRSP